MKNVLDKLDYLIIFFSSTWSGYLIHEAHLK